MGMPSVPGWHLCLNQRLESSVEMGKIKKNKRFLVTYLGGGVYSLLYFSYTCVRDLYKGGIIYLAENIIR